MGAVAVALSSQLKEVQSLAAATEISCPILVVEGEKSVNRHLINLKATAAELPHGSYLLVADAGHLIPMEKPKGNIPISINPI